MTRYNKDGMPYAAGVAQGGTGVASLTANSLLAAGTNSTNPLQSIGTGTSGQFYKSNGNASLGTWTNQNQLSGKILISTQTVSNVASIDIINLSSSYCKYEIILSGITPATANASLRILTSSNNGSSYDSGASNYAYQYTANGDTGTAGTNGGGNSAGATFIQMCEGLTNTANANDFEVILINPNIASNANGFMWQGRTLNNSSVFRSNRGQGARLASSVVNAFQFKFSSGNIASAVMKLYGYIAP